MGGAPNLFRWLLIQCFRTRESVRLMPRRRSEVEHASQKRSGSLGPQVECVLILTP
jgi:hypothetical protein